MSIEEKNYHLFGRLFAIMLWSKPAPKYLSYASYICDPYGLVTVSYSDTKITLKTSYAFWTYDLVHSVFSIMKVNCWQPPYENSGFTNMGEIDTVLSKMISSLDWLINLKNNQKIY